MTAAVLLAALALGSPPSSPEASWALDDGTTVALVENDRAEVVSIRVVFPAGTWSPWVRQAHAEEAFEFQLRDTAARLRARAQGLAVEIALAMGDRTAVLSATFLREDLDAVARLVADVLANRDYDRRELIARRRAVSLSWGLAARNPQFRLGQAAARRLFEPGDPRLRAWERPGRVATNGKKLAAARDVLVRLPGRAIGFAGAISRGEADRIARTLLPRAVEGVPSDLAPVLAPIRARAGGDDAIPVARLTQVSFALVRPSLPWTDPEDPSFLIADHVLGGHFHSRLYTALRHEGGETYGASTRNDGDVVPSVYGLGTFTKADNARRTEEKLRRVLAEFHESGITEDERAAAASHLVGRRAFSRQSPEQVLAVWMRERALGLPPGWFDDRAARASAAPLDEVNAFIRRFYDPAAFTLLQAVPAD